MTAKEKFEARLQELGLMGEWINRDAEWIGRETNKEIIVFVHFNHNDGFYSEYHYPRFDAMTREQIDILTANFASDNFNSKFLTDLARWCAGVGSCPLSVCDVYPNIEPIEEIEFEDDEDDEEEEYQTQVELNRAQIDLMKSLHRLHRRQICEMIRGELHRGHNLQADFDPYPGWDSHHLCGYEIEQKDIKVIESHEVNDDVLCIAFYQDGYEDIIIPLIADIVPIEVLMTIYASMK